ncbi:MAG: hypothetical protein QOJ29_3865 [Thermoleophilaceae bacterium]|jgi:RNA polymerase sigma-70 factor (ECF subfamily)|nr:hypothetical protein [Thermoleophilaceae bacterium]
MSLPAIQDPDNEHDDASLVHALRAGDTEAFDALFRRYYHALVTWAEWRWHDHARAEDIAQETLAAAVRYLGSFDASRPIWPWLRTIAGHIAGREARATRAEMPFAEMPEQLRPYPDIFDALDERAQVMSAFGNLSPRHQQALWLRYGEERSGPECATLMGLSANGFNQLVFRARRLLRMELEPGQNVLGIGWLVPMWMRRFWRRSTSATLRFESAVGPSASLAAISVSAAGVLGLAPMLESSAAGPDHVARPVASVRPAPATVVHRGVRSRMDRVTTAPRAFPARHAAVATPASTTVRVPVGSRPAEVTVAKNPVRTGEQEHDNVTIDTPLGPVVLYGAAQGGEGRIICQVVSCS